MEYKIKFKNCYFKLNIGQVSVKKYKKIEIKHFQYK